MPNLANSLRRAVLPLAALAAAWLTLAPAAAASNTRVSITDYVWSSRQVHVNLGEKVIWDWLGPDLSHSVTGFSPNARQWDSDPSTDAPYHPPGYSYSIQFSQPGDYAFICKLHPYVRGEVIVSEVPGDPSSDPGPQAAVKIDLKRPALSEVILERTRFRGKKGTEMSARVSERGSLEATYYRLDAKGKRAYSGFESWKTSAGLNQLRIGARWKRFAAQPGRYEAVLRASDRSANASKAVARRFTIVP